jgi:curved DNA-binding protein CbpA
MKTYYEVLGVPPNADDTMIRAAFRKAAKIYHPDLNAGDPAAEQRFKQIAAAHSVLTNPEQRAAFDRHLQMTRQQVRREWKITLISWIVTGLLSAGLASGSVLFVRSTLSIKETPVRSFAASPDGELATGRGRETYNVGANGANNLLPVAVAHGALAHEQPGPSGEDRKSDHQSVPVTAAGPAVGEVSRVRPPGFEPGRREDTRSDIDAAGDARTNEPGATRMPPPIAANQATSPKATAQRRDVPLIVDPPLMTVPLVGATTNGHAVHSDSPGDYIFYEHSGGRCPTDDKANVADVFPDQPVSECRTVHRASRRHGTKEHRAAVRRAKFPHA